LGPISMNAKGGEYNLKKGSLKRKGEGKKEKCFRLKWKRGEVHEIKKKTGNEAGGGAGGKEIRQ